MSDLVKCSECEMSFKTDDLLQLHVVNRHPGAATVPDLQLVKTTQRRTIAEISTTGILTSSDFADFMSALMIDVVDGKVKPAAATAACAAASQMLKVVSMRYQYARRAHDEAELDEEG